MEDRYAPRDSSPKKKKNVSEEVRPGWITDSRVVLASSVESQRVGNWGKRRACVHGRWNSGILEGG